MAEVPCEEGREGCWGSSVWVWRLVLPGVTAVVLFCFLCCRCSLTSVAVTPSHPCGNVIFTRSSVIGTYPFPSISPWICFTMATSPLSFSRIFFHTRLTNVVGGISLGVIVRQPLRGLAVPVLPTLHNSSLLCASDPLV